MNAVVPWQKWRATFGSEHQVVDQAGTGLPNCLYFTTVRNQAAVTVSTYLDIPWGNWFHLQTIFDILWPNYLVTGSTVASNNLGWTTTSNKDRVWLKGSAKYTLRGQSNETEFITAYYCKPRHNISADITGVSNNVLNFLGMGFASNGLDPATTNATNAMLVNDQFSPFESFAFCKNFQIFKVKRLRISPGEQQTLFLKGRSAMLQPYDIWNQPAFAGGTTTYSSLTRRYNYMKHERFILFKLSGRPAGYGDQAPNTGNYAKGITRTTPTCVLQTEFRFAAKTIRNVSTAYQNLTSQVGIFAPAGAINPQIMRDDDFKAGVESDAI